MDRIIRRIMRAVEVLEKNLDDPTCGQKAPEAACYSPYHFGRIFHALTGMTLGTYLRRRRLTQAADSLFDKKNRIIELALEAGFDSQAAFSRAFKNMFGKTPARFRAEEEASPFRGQQALSDSYLNHLQKGAVTMNPRFEHKESFTVIGIGQDHPAGVSTGSLWDDFLSQRDKIKKPLDAAFYGICYAPPEKEKVAERFHYTAALRVAEDADVPKGMEKIRLAPQDYAVFTHKGPLADLGKTNDYIWKVWVSQSGIELADAPDFELYDHRFNPDHEDSMFDIYVPIVR